MTRIISNKIRCKSCGDIIESRSVHDFVQCSCGRVFVDGGHEYLRRGFKESMDDYEELSETEERHITNREALHELSDKSFAAKMYMLTRYECPMELLDPWGDHGGCGERCEECISDWLKEEYEG